MRVTGQGLGSGQGSGSGRGLGLGLGVGYIRLGSNDHTIYMNQILRDQYMNITRY